MADYRTPLGASIGQSLANAAGLAFGGGYAGNRGRQDAQHALAYQASAENDLADAALKRKQLAINPAEMAANELGVFGSIAQQLEKYRQTGQSDIHEQPVAYNADGEIDFSRSGPSESNIDPEQAKAYAKLVNAFTYAKPGEYKNTQEAIGQGNKNDMVQAIAKGGYSPDLGKALLLAAGKAPFASFNGGAIDETSGNQTINPIGSSMVNMHNASANQSNAGAKENLAQAALAALRGESIKAGYGDGSQVKNKDFAQIRDDIRGDYKTQWTDGGFVKKGAPSYEDYTKSWLKQYNIDENEFFRNTNPVTHAAPAPNTLGSENNKANNQDYGYGKRADGTNKGTGFLGELKRPDGRVSTELSIGVNIGGKDMEIPTLVPTLDKSEIDYLLRMKQGDSIPKEIINKAVSFAKQRINSGLPVFAGANEKATKQPSISNW